jgi:hypothetical protein
MAIDHGLQNEEQIYLDQILDLLRNTFGYDSWIANGFIKEIYAINVEDPLNEQIPTLAITKEGILYYNVSFWKKHVDTPNKVIEVITHELLHKVLGDFSRDYKENSELHNFASDSVINMTIYFMLGHADLMQSFYDTKPPMGLLRSKSGNSMLRSKFGEIYGHLYDDSRYGDKNTDCSIDQVFNALKLVMPKKYKKVVFLGSHDKEKKPGPEEETSTLDMDLDGDTKSKIASEIVDKCKVAGHGSNLWNSMISLIHSNSNLRTRLLKDFSINKNINKITEYMKEQKIISSVIPIDPCRRDIVMLAAGIIPVIWRNRINDTKKKNLGIAVYVDVSGSMNAVLPKIAGIVYSLRKNIRKVFQFSNKIVETSIEELGRGVIRSTGGTDFDCIVEHAIDKDYKKIIIFGDGFANMSKENEILAKTRIDKVCMILTDRTDNKDNFFSKQYKNTYYVKDIC